jgi:rfaE bifunctional protein nucleotidyltransferase chain/domain
MTKIHTVSSSIKIAKQIQKSGNKLVLAGGCFDLLHVGHIYFLQQAKRKGDFLMLLLESDETVKKLKGEKRPINSQIQRAKMLEALEAVDYVMLLKPLYTNKDYDELVLRLKPAIIATTKGDLFQKHKKRQAELVNAKVVSIKKLTNASTSQLAKQIFERFYL